MWILALTFLKNNWKLVLIGLSILSLLSYIAFIKWEVRHYRSLYQNAMLELAQAESREAKLNEINIGITEKYKSTLKTVNAEIDKNNKLLTERIKLDKELKSLRLSLNAIKLFNESKRDPSTATSETIQRNDGETDSSTTTQSVPLSTVFQVVAENDSNHWKCIKQVEQWQRFWQDYESAVKQVSQ